MNSDYTITYKKKKKKIHLQVKVLILSTAELAAGADEDEEDDINDDKDETDPDQVGAGIAEEDILAVSHRLVGRIADVTNVGGVDTLVTTALEEFLNGDPVLLIGFNQSGNSLGDGVHDGLLEGAAALDDEDQDEDEDGDGKTNNEADENEGGVDPEPATTGRGAPAEETDDQDDDTDDDQESDVGSQQTLDFRNGNGTSEFDVSSDTGDEKTEEAEENISEN